MRVLYVDDDRVNAVLFAEACRAAGGIVLECADSGVEAHGLLGEFAPDLLVIDLNLADTRGDRLLGELRAVASRRLPAVLFTAEHETVGRAAAAAGDFDHCWTKPLHMPEVIDALRRLAASTGGVA